MAWTRQSYDALYEWGNKSRRATVRKLLLADGLAEVVARLEASKNMGEWYKITHEAVAAVGPGIVSASATQAKKELDAEVSRHCLCVKCGYDWIPRKPTPRQCPNCKRQDWRSK